MGGTDVEEEAATPVTASTLIRTSKRSQVGRGTGALMRYMKTRELVGVRSVRPTPDPASSGSW
jgi:hypothetical protein